MSPPLDRRTLSRRAFATGCALFPFSVARGAQSPVAQDASPASKEDIFRYAFGDYNICLFNTDEVGLSSTLGAANATFEEQNAVARELGPFMMNNAVAVVDTGEQLVLLDAGPWTSLPDRLEQEGFRQDEIDVVTFSHLHFDHTDGAFTIAHNAPAFANARYVVSKAEHDYWMADDDPRLSEYVEPYIGWMRSDAQSFIEHAGDQLELVDWDEEFLPGMRMISAIGHSGGHAAVEITSGDETLLHVGDLICNEILHLHHPEWFIAAAVWPEDDLASRRTLMDRAAEEHLLVQTVHFPFPGVGYVEKDGDAWRWIPLE